MVKSKGKSEEGLFYRGQPLEMGHVRASEAGSMNWRLLGDSGNSGREGKEMKPEEIHQHSDTPFSSLSLSCCVECEQ